MSPDRFPVYGHLLHTGTTFDQLSVDTRTNSLPDFQLL